MRDRNQAQLTLRALRLAVLLGAVGLLMAPSCGDGGDGGLTPCENNAECGVVCAADCVDDGASCVSEPPFGDFCQCSCAYCRPS